MKWKLENMALVP